MVIHMHCRHIRLSYVTVQHHTEIVRDFKPFLQQCALRSQDFAVCHREYSVHWISKSGPVRIRIQSGLCTEKLSVQCIFRVRKFS